MAEMRLTVAGAAGRMGRALIRLISDTPGCRLTGAIEQAGSRAIGQDAGELAGLAPCGIIIQADVTAATADCDGILDFTTPESSVAFAELASRVPLVYVIGTTGLETNHHKKLKFASRHSVVVQSGNMSVGLNIVAALARRLASVLHDDWDIEILEMHHREKVDAPSGAALLLGEAIAKGRDLCLADQMRHSRNGITGRRETGTIGFASLRGGSVVGDHKLIFATQGERVELSHIAEDRTLFAAGALKAALWAFGRKPGLYSMADVLGLADW